MPAKMIDVTLQRLMLDGERAAEWRGHDLGPWQVGEHRTRCRSAKCRVCGMGVWINPRPAPNGIDISGEAVALDCRRVS